MRISGVTYAHRKTHRIRKITMLIIILTISALIIITGISSFVGWNLTHPERLSIPVFTANIVPDYTSVSFKDIKDDITLKGWFFEVKGSNKTVILAHGYGRNRLQFGEKTIDLIKALLNQGYNVLTFDFRNCGESEGSVTTVGLYEKNDLLGAIKYSKTLGSKQIVLMGFSMGASTSIAAAAESEDVDAVIADSPFADMAEYLNSSLSAWSKLPSFPFNKTTLLSMKILTGVNPEKFSPRSVISQIAPRPILLIHSRDDAYIPVKNSRELLKEAGNTATLWETQDVNHVQSFQVYTEQYLNKTTQFLNKLNIDSSNLQN